MMVRESADMAVIPKEELKKLLSIVESTKKLEKRIEELEQETQEPQESATRR
jgi:hypothetical protein